jgi:hypothetical protein
MRGVILAPVDNSPFSRAVTALCHRKPGVQVAGIIVRKILNPSRLRSEFRRDGVRLIRKIWEKFILAGEDAAADKEPGFSDLAENAGIGRERLSAFTKRTGIPYLRVDDHNDPDAVAALQAMRPDVVVFTGGGIIRQPLLDVSGAGIFNTHMSPPGGGDQRRRPAGSEGHLWQKLPHGRALEK